MQWKSEDKARQKVWLCEGVKGRLGERKVKIR